MEEIICYFVHSMRTQEVKCSGLVLITEKVLPRRKKRENHLPQTASWPPPHNQQLEMDLCAPHRGVSSVSRLLLVRVATVITFQETCN